MADISDLPASAVTDGALARATARVDALARALEGALGLARAMDVEAACRLALSSVRVALSASRGLVVTSCPEDGARARACDGLSDAVALAAVAHLTAHHVADVPGVVAVEDVRASDVLGALGEALRADGAVGVAIVPVVASRRALGEVIVAFDGPRTLDDVDLRVARSIGGKLALVLERTAATRALEASEAGLREAQAIARIGSFRWDVATGEVVWSDELYRLYGKQRGEFVPTFEGYVACIDERDRGEVVASLQRCMADRGTFDHEYRIASASPTEPERWMYARGRARIGASGELAGLEGTCQEITDRKRAEAAIRELEQQVRQAQKMEALGRLSGGIAHDFNNELSVIAGNTELAIADLPEDHPAHESLGLARAACSRAAALVQQILGFSSRQPVERRPLALASVVDETARFLRSIVPANVEIARLVDPATPDVLADATQMQQALVNLCMNAWQAMEGRPGRIEIQVRAVSARAVGTSAALDTAAAWTELAVIDDGPGMAPEIVERMFDPFFTTRPFGQGTGLGLSTVHAIVTGHAGSIRVDSEPGRGTTVRVFLPAHVGATPPRRRTSEPAPAAGGLRVVYVDDEPAIGSMMSRVLRRFGYDASVFASPEEARAAILDLGRPIDLLIADMNMPDLTGMQLARIAREARPGLPVILMSGHASDDVRAEADRSGVARVLDKPFELRALQRTIEELFPRAR